MFAVRGTNLISKIRLRVVRRFMASIAKSLLEWNIAGRDMPMRINKENWLLLSYKITTLKFNFKPGLISFIKLRELWCFAIRYFIITEIFYFYCLTYFLICINFTGIMSVFIHWWIHFSREGNNIIILKVAAIGNRNWKTFITKI